ncbi:MAG: hypothetical protein FJW26_02755 [Acidimicrobiia bacterium]|nr:hypothetical protein [Acidimicrobiia bacterium]
MNSNPSKANDQPKKRLTLFLLTLLFRVTLVAGEKTSDFCKVCHSDTVTDFLSHAHSKNGLDCDTCHGASIKHRSSQGHSEPDQIAAPHEVPALCGACHTGKGSTTIAEQYASSKHGQLVLSKARTRAPHCGSCHGVHGALGPLEILAQCKRCHTKLPESCRARSSAAKASVGCADCHAAHGFAVKK